MEVSLQDILNAREIADIILEECEYQKDGVRSVRNIIHDLIGNPIIAQIMVNNHELCVKAEEGKILVLDRYTTSSLLYQSAYIDNIRERKAFIDFVCDYEYNKLRIKIPDKVL